MGDNQPFGAHHSKQLVRIERIVDFYSGKS